MMDISQLPIILEFLRIHEEEGPDAAIAWAARMEAEMAPGSTLEGLESSDKKPSLRIVR
jgi:hypothetical protein